VVYLVQDYTCDEITCLSDIDILVDGNVSESEFLYEISRELNIPVEKIDLVRVRDISLRVLVKALREGIVVICRGTTYLTRLIEYTILN